MVSAIDPTKPVDGVPASKADLRQNLAIAKNEISALQEASASLSPYALAGMRNRIINGAFAIDSRNGGSSVVVASGGPLAKYGMDMWKGRTTGGIVSYTIQRTQASPPPQSRHTNYVRITVTANNGTLAAGNMHCFQQDIEGIHIADFLWGTANAIPITIQFWVRGSIAGPYSVSLANWMETLTYQHQFTITAPNIWQLISFPVVGPSTGTWLTNNLEGLSLRFDLGSGTTYQGATDVWTTSNITAAASSTRLVQTNGATLDITGVQVEPGDIATAFETRLFAVEQGLCERYYEEGTINGAYYQASGGQSTQWRVAFNTPKRAQPTLTPTTAGTSNVTLPAAITSDVRGFFIIVTNVAAGTYYYNATFKADAGL